MAVDERTRDEEVAISRSGVAVFAELVKTKALAHRVTLLFRLFPEMAQTENRLEV